MAAVSSASASRLSRTAVPDPLYPIWRWLTSVRNAIALILLVALFAFAGVIVPQVPPSLIDSPAAVAQHIDNQRPTFDHVPVGPLLLPLVALGLWLIVRLVAGGREIVPPRGLRALPLSLLFVSAGLALGFVGDAAGLGDVALTDPLADFPWLYDTNGGVFNLFNQPYWFVVVAVLALAITTCTISRFPPIWRSVRRPQRRVNDRYFERARQRMDFANPADAATTTTLLGDALRARRFAVHVEQREGAHYLFADRHQWAQLATFVSHLALILLVIATLLTKFGGEELQFWVGEGQSHPLFATGGDRQQVQVIVDDAIARFNDEGQALDFRSLVRVTTGGEQVAAGEVTVNGPLHAAGFRVHQAAYWEHGAALQVRDADTGQLLYSEALMLQEQFFGPRIVTADAVSGTVFADEVVQLRHAVPDLEGAAYELIPLAEEISVALILVPDDGGVRFHYALLPINAQSPQAPRLSSLDLRIGEPAPLAPRLRLRDADGELLIETVVPLQQTDLATGLGERLGLLPLPDGTILTVGYAGEERTFFYFDQADESRRGLLVAGESVALGAATLEYVAEDRDRSSHGSLAPGESQIVGRVELTYGGAESVFFALVDDLPGASSQSVVAIERFGQALTSSEFNAFGGENVDLDRSTVSGRYADRPARLGIGLGDVPRFDLDEGEARVIGDYEYDFLGPREFTGLNLRRDPGGTVFWIAIILGTIGLLTTFFVPRRRIWARITNERTYLAGLAAHGVDMRRRDFQPLAEAIAAPGIAPVEPQEGEDWDR